MPTEHEMSDEEWVEYTTREIIGTDDPELVKKLTKIQMEFLGPIISQIRPDPVRDKIRGARLIHRANCIGLTSQRLLLLCDGGESAKNEYNKATRETEESKDKYNKLIQQNPKYGFSPIP